MNSDDYEYLGSKIKTLRQQMNLTQTDVAAALNVTPGYISNVENNRTAMSLRVLIYYARLMNISLDALIGQIDSDYQTSALYNELLQLIADMNDEEKMKLIKTIKIWKKN